MISKQSSSGTAKGCFQIEGNRPSTPPEIRKFRQTSEPGKKYIHHGIADDFKSMGLDNKVFGTNAAGQNTRASDLIQSKTPSQYKQIENLKAERVYASSKREQLGRPYERNVVLPSKYTEGQPFGASTRIANNSVKDIVFPEDAQIDERGEEIYIRTHHSYKPAQQTDRHYNWPINPHETRFGVKCDVVPHNGASQLVYDVLHSPVTYSSDEVKKISSKYFNEKKKRTLNCYLFNLYIYA